MTFAGLSLYAAASAVLTALLCLYARPIGKRFALIDMPSPRKIHRTETPLMGGIVLLFALAPVTMAAILFDSPRHSQPGFTVWLGCVCAMAMIGIADDRHSLSPRARLILSFALFGIAAAIDPTFNVRVLDFEHPTYSLGLGTWSVAILFMMLCCVGLVNAVNMADGKNGLVIGLCFGWLALLGLRATPPMMPLIFILGAVLLVMLIFNLMGRLFLGDGGAYGLASAIGLLSIMIYNTPGPHGVRAVSAEELVVLFFVPVIDSFRLSFVRWRQGRSPMDADRDHLHHHLQDRFGWPAGLFIYWAVALAPAALLFWKR